MQAGEGNWLYTDEIEEFIDSLEFSVELLQSAKVDYTHWKWVIIALHNALQGACVCALRGVDTSGVAVLSNMKQMWNWLDVLSRKKPAPAPPEERLADLMTLYKRVRCKSFLPVPLVVAPEVSDDVRRLNNLRNEFIHFVPKGWSIEVSGMPRIVRNVSRVIEHLAVKYPTFGHHLNENQAQSIARSVSRLLAHP